MNYKDKFYAKYVSTHLSPYKGKATSDTLKGMAIVWGKIFGRFLPENKSARIIDLGCGYGSIVWWLQKSGFTSVQGIDISAEQVEIGRSLGVTNIEQADIKEFLQDKKDSYDMIFMRSIIEHFYKQDMFEILSLCYKSLKNEGRIIIQVPNAESPFGGHTRYGDFTHEIAFTATSMSQLLRVVGFNEVHSYPYGPLPYLLDPISLLRFVLWKIIEAFYKFLLWVELGNLSRTSIVSQNITTVAIKRG